MDENDLIEEAPAPVATPDLLADIIEAPTQQPAQEFVGQLTQDFNQAIEDEATAAGAEAGDAGHNFVDIGRILEAVPGAGYDFPTNPTGTPPQIKGEAVPEQHAAADPVVVTPADPTLSPDPTPTPDPTPDPTPNPIPEPTPDDHGGPKGNNGWGNGDQDAPGNSGDHNNAENNTSGKEDPSHGSNGSNESSSGGSTSDSGGSGGNIAPGGGSDGSDNSEHQGGPKGNNGWGNGDQDAPGNSGPNNNAENNTSGKEDPSHGNNSLKLEDLITTEDTSGNSGGNSNHSELSAIVDLITDTTKVQHHE